MSGGGSAPEGMECSTCHKRIFYTIDGRCSGCMRRASKMSGGGSAPVEHECCICDRKFYLTDHNARPVIERICCDDCYRDIAQRSRANEQTFESKGLEDGDSENPYTTCEMCRRRCYTGEKLWDGYLCDECEQEVPESTPPRPSSQLFKSMPFFKNIVSREVSADGKHLKETLECGVVGGGQEAKEKLQRLRELLKAFFAQLDAFYSEKSQKKKQKMADDPEKIRILIVWNQNSDEIFDRVCSKIKNWTGTTSSPPPSELARSVISRYLVVAKFNFDGENGDWSYNSVMGWWLDITVRFPTVSEGSLFVRMRVLPDYSSRVNGGFVIQTYDIVPVPEGRFTEADSQNLEGRLHNKRRRENPHTREDVVALAQQAVKRGREERETPVVSPPATRSRAVAGGGAVASAPAPRTETPRPETPPLVRANRSAGDTSFDSAKKTDKRKKQVSKLKEQLANMTEKARQQQSEDAEVVEFWKKSAHKRNSKGKKK